LHWATAPENTESLQKLLELRADPNARTIQRATPIMNASQSNKIKHLKMLLHFGADVNTKDDRGFTALHRASEMGHKEIVTLLLENGADKSIVAEGYTALLLAQNREQRNNGTFELKKHSPQQILIFRNSAVII
jgi:ankyrin repeat protein